MSRDNSWSLKEEITCIKDKLNKIADGQEALGRIVAGDHALLHDHLNHRDKKGGFTLTIKKLFGIGS